MDKVKEATFHIGQYLVLSSQMERHINQCLEHFRFDKPVFHSIEKESFDFKCKRVRNYLQLLQAYNLTRGMDLQSFYEGLASLEVQFHPIRKMRNFLAHAIPEKGDIKTTRLQKGENGACLEMSFHQLESELENLHRMVEFSRSFFEKLEQLLLSLAKKKGPQADPFSLRENN